MALIRLCGKWPKAGKYQAVIWLYILQFVTGSLPISNMIFRQRHYKTLIFMGLFITFMWLFIQSLFTKHTKSWYIDYQYRIMAHRYCAEKLLFLQSDKPLNHTGCKIYFSCRKWFVWLNVFLFKNGIDKLKIHEPYSHLRKSFQLILWAISYNRQ